MKKKISLTSIEVKSFAINRELVHAKGGNESQAATQCRDGGCYTYYWGPCLSSPGVHCSYELCD